MNKFLEKHNLLKLTQIEIENLNTLKTRKTIKLVTTDIPRIKRPVTIEFTLIASVVKSI
jgi:hypothetical protein